MRQISPKPPRPASGRRAGGLTVVRTMGVGTPSIVREPVRPQPVDARVVEAAETALRSLTVLTEHAGLIAAAFEAGRVLEGQRGLIHLVRGTQTLLRLAAVAARTGGEDLLATGQSREADAATREAVDRLITCQLGLDWPGLAATLRHQFAPALQQWGVVFQTLGGLPLGPGPGSRAA